MNDKRLDTLFINIVEIIAAKELQAYYQPVYDLKERKIVGLEALARIVKKNGEVVPPGRFIPFLEESKDALKLDWAILEDVCSHLAEMKKKGLQLVPVSINFSKMHAIEQDFLDKLCKIVDKYGIDHNLIILEVTEESLEYYADDAKYLVNCIKENGFKLSVDNFGTGISSLSFIRETPFDILKIDRSIVAMSEYSLKDRIIIKTMIELGEALGAVVVLEGIETSAQLEELRGLGCKKAQGFLLSKPMNVASLYGCLK